MNILRSTSFALLACICQEVAHGASDVQATVSKVAQVLAPKIAARVISKQGSEKYDVAVFAFGNEEGANTPSFGAAGKIMQGELIFELNRAASTPSGDKFNTLTKAELKQRTSGLSESDLKKLGGGSPTEIATIMSSVGLGAVVVGSIDAKNYKQLIDDHISDVPVTGRIVTKDGSSATFNARVATADVGEIGGVGPTDEIATGPSRFSVGVVVDGSARTLVKGPANTVFQRVLFLELDPADVGKEYVLKIKNDPGAGGVDSNDVDEFKRLWAVAVLVDGVNTIYQDTGKSSGFQPEIGPVVRHPVNCMKWVMSGPRQFFQGSELKDTPPGETDIKFDHSILNVLGFQKKLGDEGLADKFTLAEKGGSIAATVGLKNDIGIIEMHFYPQRITTKLARTWPAAGDVEGETRPGATVQHQTQNVLFSIEGNPSEVWRIHYYYKGKVPEEDGVPILQVAQDSDAQDND